MVITVPTILTLIRLFVAPFIYPFFLYYGLHISSFFIPSILALFFMALCVTDFLDGYLARRWNQETELGKLLDPLADKCLAVGSFVVLVALKKIYFYWAILFTARELFITGLRYAAEQRNLSVPVSGSGKVKTALQYIFITVTIGEPWPFISAHIVSFIKYGSLITALGLSFVSAIVYYQTFMKQWKGTEIE